MTVWKNRPAIRRTLFVLANLCVVILLIDYVVGPLQTFFAQRDLNISERRELLARLTALAGEEANIAGMARQIDYQFAGKELFFRGPKTMPLAPSYRPD